VDAIRLELAIRLLLLTAVITQRSPACNGEKPRTRRGCFRAESWRHVRFRRNGRRRERSGGPAAPANARLFPLRKSEIRFVRSRDRGFGSREPLGVFGANMFRPFNQREAIRYGRRPGHRKGAFILDRELELQVLAPIAFVPGPPGDLIFPRVPFHAFSCSFVVDEPISFDHMQSPGVGVPNLSIMETGPTLNPTVSMTSVSPS
jgi:hypothetical protein